MPPKNFALTRYEEDRINLPGAPRPSPAAETVRQALDQLAARERTQAIERAFESLDDRDRGELIAARDRLVRARIHNFGEASALELLAALGRHLNTRLPRARESERPTPAG